MRGNTYVVDVFLSDELLHLLQLELVIVDPLREDAKRVLNEIQLIHDLVQSGLDFWPQHLEGRSDSLIAKHLLRSRARRLRRLAWASVGAPVCLESDSGLGWLGWFLQASGASLRLIRQLLDFLFVSDEDVGAELGLRGSVQFFAFLWVQVGRPDHNVLISSSRKQIVAQG